MAFGKSYTIAKPAIYGYILIPAIVGPRVLVSMYLILSRSLNEMSYLFNILYSFLTVSHLNILIVSE